MTAVNLLPYLVYKTNFIIHAEKIYTGFSTVLGFRYPLGVPEIRGASVLSFLYFKP